MTPPLGPWRALVALAILFSLSAVAGYAMTPWLVSQGVEDMLRSAFGSIVGLPAPLLFMAILFNNLVKAFLVMMLGLGLGVMPVVFAVLNGLVLGLAINLTPSAGLAAAAILPHGIIEIPAALLAAALGMSLGQGVWRKLRGQELSLSSRVADAVKVFVLVVAPALVVSAAVEAFVTPFVVAAVRGA